MTEWTADRIAALRLETPGTKQVVHFNNAGASLMPDPVYRAVIDQLELERSRGGYEAAALASEEIAGVARSVGQLINARPLDIALMDSATRGWTAAFAALSFSPGDRILTTSSEYASNFIAYLQVRDRCGVSVEIIPDDEYGILSIPALESRIDGTVKLITLNHLPTHDGLVNPAAEVGRIARAAGILFMLDACQSVGQMPLDVEAIGCDILTATGRKFLRGPRGTGFLFIRQEVAERLEPPALDLQGADWLQADRYEARPGSQRFEQWEFSPALRLGLGTSIEYAMELGLQAICDRVQVLASTLRQQLSSIAGVQVRDRGRQQSGIVTFTVAGHDPFELQSRLRMDNINVSVSKVRSARADAAWQDHDARIRASVHYYNTFEEIDRLCQSIEQILHI